MQKLIETFSWGVVSFLSKRFNSVSSVHTTKFTSLTMIIPLKFALILEKINNDIYFIMILYSWPIFIITVYLCHIIIIMQSVVVKWACYLSNVILIFFYLALNFLNILLLFFKINYKLDNLKTSPLAISRNPNEGSICMMGINRSHEHLLQGGWYDSMMGSSKFVLLFCYRASPPLQISENRPWKSITNFLLNNLIMLRNH